MPVYVSPGTYTREIDLSLYIPRISSTIFGVVGTSPRGPVNEPKLITNIGALTSTFGEPHPNHLALYSAMQYLRFGRQLYFVRVNGSGSTTASVSPNGQTAAAVLYSNVGPFAITDESLASTTGTDQNATRDVTSANKKLLVSINGGSPVEITLTENTGVTKATIAGEIDAALDAYGGDCTVVGTNQIKIAGRDLGSTARVDIFAINNNAYTLLGLTAGTYYGTDDNRDFTLISVDRSSGSEVETDETITLTAGSARTVAQIVAEINATTLPITATVVDNKIKLTHDSVGQHYGIKITHDDTETYDLGSATTLGFTEDVTKFGRGLTPASATMTFSAIASGSWGNDLKVVVSAGSATDTFKVQIKDGTTVVEQFDNLTGNFEDASVANGILFVEDAINNVSKYVTVLDTVTNTGFPINGTYSLTGGADGLESISEDDFIGTVNGSTRTGLQLFKNVDLYDLNIIAVPGISSAAVIDEMIAICEERHDCMALVDPPLNLSVQQVVDWHNGAAVYNDHDAFNSSYAATYGTWMQVFDAANDQYVWTPPSGHAASAFAFNDANAELWSAPAGPNRGLVNCIKVGYSPDQGERDTMYANGNAINPIVTFPKDGTMIYGQRTLQRKPTALDRIGPRRMLLYLRKVIAAACRYLEFEPNDSFTWNQFVGIVDPYLATVKSRRGLYDYRVLCDETTNPPELIDQGVMGAKIFLKPTKAAEIIQIDFVLTKTGAVFDELIAAGV